MEAVDHEKKIRTASLPILRPDIEHTAKVSLTTRGEIATNGFHCRIDCMLGSATSSNRRTPYGHTPYGHTPYWTHAILDTDNTVR